METMRTTHRAKNTPTSSASDNLQEVANVARTNSDDQDMDVPEVVWHSNATHRQPAAIRRTSNGHIRYKAARPPRRTTASEISYYVTLNLAKFNSRFGGDTIALAIEYRGYTISLDISKDTTRKQLREEIRKEFHIVGHNNFSLTHLQHTLIEDEDKEILKLGIKTGYGRLSILPDQLSYSDEVVLKYDQKQ